VYWRVAPVSFEEVGRSLPVARRTGQCGALRRLLRIQSWKFRVSARRADSCGAARTFICSSRAWRREHGAARSCEIYIKEKSFSDLGVLFWLVTRD
ncbi:hypothetical protein A2U01_0058119, partial [Trifolium medium]|nr:hypothetical protein [Trifolium medium]